MKVRRRKWLVPALVGIPLFLVVAFLIVLKSATPEVPALTVISRDIPDVWLVPDADEDSVADPVGEAVHPPLERHEPLAFDGTLAVLGQSKAFAEEAYAIRVSDETATLTSTGRFWFKVVLATINIPFSQRLEADSDLRPTTYTAQFDAPLGFDQSIDGVITSDRAEVDRGNGLETILVSQDEAFVMGTFSSYAMLPILYERRQIDGIATFEVLVFGGPPQGGRPQGEGEQNGDLAGGRPAAMRVERTEDVSIRAGGAVLTVEQFAVSGHLGESLIFAKNGDFLGMIAGEEGEGLRVYRSDYFPDGFEVSD